MVAPFLGRKGATFGVKGATPPLKKGKNPNLIRHLKKSFSRGREDLSHMNKIQNVITFYLYIMIK